MKKEFQLSDRREFLADSLRSAALFTALASGHGQAAEKTGTANPFAYDVSRLSKTDPKLIAHEEAARWKSPHPEPKRIAAGPGDTLYVCAGNYITAMSREGAQDGTIFVGLRDHVEVFDAKGQRRAIWESLGKKSWLTALAVSESDVFAADSGNRVLLRYDKSGKLVSRIGEKNKEHDVPGFVIPSPYLDVEIARDGLLRVNNPGRHRVEAYTFRGDFEGAWGKPAMAIDSFCGCCNPIALALLPDGRFVTCEKGLPRVKIYSDQGRFESVVARTESFPENAKACTDLNDCTHGGMDAAVDSEGRIYILDFVTEDIRVMRRNTKV
jgi:hypothetical protein